MCPGLLLCGGRFAAGNRTVLSPTACGRSPLAEGARDERTFFDSLTGETNLSLTSFCALCALPFFAAQAF